MSKYKYCSKHFVSLNWFDQDIKKHPKDEPWRHFAVSGFVMSIEDQWFLATAGHILHDIEYNRKNNETRVRSMGLHDHGGVEAKFTEPFPFPFCEADKHFMYDEDRGIDFGFIRIEPFYRKIMEANAVKAIPESHWNTDDEFEATEYFVLGIPSALKVLLNKYQGGDTPLTGFARITVLEIDLLPQDEEQKEFPRICGKPKNFTVTKPEHVDGFSGGPLIGLGAAVDGKIPYRVLGMQHSWDNSQKVVWANPLKLIGELIQKKLRGEEFP